MSHISREIRLRKFVEEVVQPFEGQLPRPWMTDSKEPWNCPIMIVGANPATKYPENIKDRLHRALFNENGEFCRKLYDEVRGIHPERGRGSSKKSQTRSNEEKYFTDKLKQYEIFNVLETNTIFLASKELSDIREATRKEVRPWFARLWNLIQPRFAIVFGLGAIREFSRALYRGTQEARNIEKSLRKLLPQKADELRYRELYGARVYPTNGFAQGKYLWKGAVDEITDALAADIVRQLR